MALTDTSDHPYLRSTLRQLQDKSWDAKERLEEWIEHGDGSDRRHHPRGGRSGRTPAGGKRRQHAPAASTGCGSQVLAVGSLAAAGAALVIRFARRSPGSA